MNKYYHKYEEGAYEPCLTENCKLPHYEVADGGVFVPVSEKFKWTDKAKIKTKLSDLKTSIDRLEKAEWHIRQTRERFQSLYEDLLSSIQD